jgi:hypothetical protein
MACRAAFMATTTPSTDAAAAGVPRLVPKIFRFFLSITSNFWYMYEVLNVDEKN